LRKALNCPVLNDTGKVIGRYGKNKKALISTYESKKKPLLRLSAGAGIVVPG
jgi:hypothetical protein